jgi:hypothetical protein
VNAFNFDVNIVQQIEEELLDVSILLLILLLLEIGFEFFEGLLDDAFLTFDEDLIEIKSILSCCNQHIDVTDVDSQTDLFLTPREMNVNSLHIAVFQFYWKIEFC